MGNYMEAVTLSGQALNIKSTDPVALNARALELFKLGRYEGPVVAYDKLLVVQENRVDAYCNQGYAYFRTKKYDA
ncbi:MAG: tetratricopeptide repeat protein [Methanomicrobiales archaeon]